MGLAKGERPSAGSHACIMPGISALTSWRQEDPREFESHLSYIVSFRLACLRRGGERMGQRREREKGKEAWLS